MNESWKSVLDWEGLYEVSNHGSVRSIARWTIKGVRGGKLLEPYLRPDSYYEVYLYDGNTGRRRNARVHHLVLEAFVGPRPEGQEALHGPGGKLDNHWPENISWGTRAQNMGEDRVRDHQSNRGEHHGLTPLTWANICEIRELLKTPGVFQKDIAIQFGVSKQTITNIKTGHTWAHPPEEW